MTQVKPNRSPIAAALALALSLPAPILLAGERSPAPDGATDPAALFSAGSLALASKLDRVEVNGRAWPQPATPKLTEPLRDTPQSITVVTAELMQQQGVTTLREALGNVPGISLQAGEGGVPAGDNLSLRGFSARTDLFVDGIRDFGGYARDPFNIEQIEVVKGPASAQNGRGATGGAITLTSKLASNQAFQRGSVGVGSDGFHRGSADINTPIGERSALRINAMAHGADVAGRDAVENERRGIAPTLHVGLGDAELHFSLFHLQQDNVPDYGQPWVPGSNNALPASRDARAPVDRRNWYGLLDRDHEDTTTDMATVQVELPLGANVDLRNVSRWGRSERDSIITAPRFLGNDSTAIRRTAKTRDSEDRILANVTDVVARIDAGGVQHTLVAGIELTREDSENRARAATDGDLADLFDPDFRAPYTGTISADPLRDAQADADSVAAYLFDTVQLSPRWSLTGGLRRDRFEVASEGYVTALAARQAFARTDTMLSGRAALQFKPSEASTLYVGYGTAFNPSAEGLSLNPDTAGLAPEESRTLELGGKWSLFDDRLLLTSAVFRTEKTNARTEDVVTEIVVLEGEQRVDGFELGATGRIGERWTVFGGYAFLDSEIVESLDPAEQGNELGNTPQHSASLWTTFEASDRLQFGFGGRHVGARWSNATNTRQAKAYSVFDAMAAFELNDRARLRFNGYNLFDKNYIESVGGGHYVPGPARSWVASVDLAF